MMWRSLQIDEDFRWITASEICIILHIIWKLLLILGWRNVQMSDYHCRADAVILNVTTRSVTPSSQGTGYSGFQVTGMLECGQKSTLPPPPRKKYKGFLTKPKKSLHKNLPPSQKKNKTKQNKTCQERPCTRTPAPSMFTLMPSEYRTLAPSVNAALLFRVQQRK